MKLPERGDRIADKYRIEGVLGEGGFGRVYLAETDVTLRRVAIKVLKAEGDDSQLRTRRFLRELQTIAGLSHPSTVTLYDYGRTDDGLLFMVCEYVAGLDLSDLLEQRGRLSEGETIHVLLQVLESLREAHQAGILHRDIKPDNIRVTTYQGDPLVVKVLDFGIAKSLAGDQPGLTATGKVIGTPRYMSPEQLTGEPLSATSDVYSLGLIAFEMLTGRPAGQPAVLRRLQFEPADEVGEALADVVLRMIDPIGTRRAKSAEQVIHALRDLQPDTKRPPPPQLPATLGAVPSTSEDTVGESPGSEVAGRRVPWGVLGGITFGIAITLVALQLPRPEEPEKPPRIPDALNVTRPAAKMVAAPEPDLAAPEPADAALEDIGKSSDGCGRPQMSRGGGDHYRVVQAYEGQRGELGYVLPSPYDPDQRYPVLLLLHAAAQTDVRLINDSGAARVADEHGFVIVAPRDRALSTPWRDGDEVDKVADALEYLDKRFCIDRSRVFVLGVGAGAQLAERLPCQLDQIRGVATVGYRSSGERWCDDRSKRVPQIHFDGLTDGYLPPEGGKSCNGLVVNSLEENEAFWRETQGCAADRTSHLEQGSHRCWTWACEVPYVSCHLDGGRGFHGQQRRTLDFLRCDGDPPNFDIAATAWDFFSASTDR